MHPLRIRPIGWPPDRVRERVIGPIATRLGSARPRRSWLPWLLSTQDMADAFGVKQGHAAIRPAAAGEPCGKPADVPAAFLRASGRYPARA
ncbi:hypothetical protein AQ611_05800 [Burkholderia singularis]|nr:hypothetical protein AQ611_05800 [Burkholderia sp. Bp7605]